MFLETIKARPLLLYASRIPQEELGLFHQDEIANPDAAIREYLDAVKEHPDVRKINDAIFDDFMRARAYGKLGGALEVEDQGKGIRNVEFLNAWNCFLEGDFSSDIRAVLIEPVNIMIETEAVRLFTPTKYKRGAVQSRHEAAPIDRETVNRRMQEVSRTLDIYLSNGTAPRHHGGAITSHRGPGMLRVKLEQGRPVLERARNVENAISRTWRRVPLQESEVLQEDLDIQEAEAEPEF